MNINKNILFFFFAVQACITHCVAEVVTCHFQITEITSRVNTAGLIPNGELLVGPVAPGKIYTFLFDYSYPGLFMLNNGNPGMKFDTPTRDYFFCDHVSGDFIQPIDNGYYNDPTHVAHYNFGWDSLLAGVAQRTILWGGSQNCKFEITMDSPAAQWTLGTSGTFREIDYKSNGTFSSISGKVVLVSWDVNPVPVAENDTILTFEDTPFEINVLRNDYDPQGEPIAIAYVNPAVHGITAVTGDSTILYTPNLNYFGNDTFVYVISDPLIGQTRGKVYVTILPINDAPVAAADSYTVDEDNTLIIDAPGVLANDFDPDGDNLKAILVNSAVNGSLTLIETGAFTYIPYTNYYGTDHFTYKANDGTAESNIITVTITVKPVNDPPIAVNDSFTTTEDKRLRVTAINGVLKNDIDPENTPLSAVLVSGVRYGSISLNSDGSFTYTPAANFYGTDYFTYRATDGSTQSNIATVKIIVHPEADAPKLNLVSVASVVRGHTLSFVVSAHDADGTIPSLFMISGPNGALFTDSGNGKGLFSWTHSEPDTEPQYTVLFRAEDESGLFDQQSVTIYVINSPQLTNGIVGWWEFEEGSGSIAYNGLGNGFNGTITGATQFSREVPNALSNNSTYSLYFDGSGDVRVLENIGLFNQYTLCAWVNADQPQVSSYARLIDYGDKRGVIIIYSEGSRRQIYMNVRNSAGTSFSTARYTLEPGWHHVAGVLEADTIKLYVDGVLRAKRGIRGPLSEKDSRVYIGSENGANRLKGHIDDVRIYQRVLSQAEISALAQGQGFKLKPLAKAVAYDSKASKFWQKSLDSLSDFTDLSYLINWGGNYCLKSAFAVADTFGKKAFYITSEAMNHAGFDSITALKSFTSLDFRFPNVINHQTSVTTISWYMRWDSSSMSPDSAYFSAILLTQYPSDGVFGEDMFNFIGDPYGVPAVHAHIRPSLSSVDRSYLAYGGGNGGQFLIHKEGQINRWWLPGIIDNADGSDSAVIGKGSEYPLGSWKRTSINLGNTDWALYKYIIYPDCQQLYRNDTLVGYMELPRTSVNAPDYRYYESFSALRLYFRGLAPCYMANLEVKVEPYTPTTFNRAPTVVLRYPSTDTSVIAGEGLVLLAEAFDDEAVDKVEFYYGTTKIGQAVFPPYECLWEDIPIGIHEVKAIASDFSAKVSVSPVIRVIAVNNE